MRLVLGQALKLGWGGEMPGTVGPATTALGANPGANAGAAGVTSVWPVAACINCWGGLAAALQGWVLAAAGALLAWLMGAVRVRSCLACATAAAATVRGCWEAACSAACKGNRRESRHASSCEVSTSAAKGLDACQVVREVGSGAACIDLLHRH